MGTFRVTGTPWSQAAWIIKVALDCMNLYYYVVYGQTVGFGLRTVHKNLRQIAIIIL